MPTKEYPPSAALWGFNHTANDPMLREPVTTGGFGIAESIAMDCKRTAHAASFGLAAPSVMAPHLSVPQFKSECTTRCRWHDLGRAT
jgi:hypothetical protein